MQTFLPCGDHQITAKILDLKRLNKQLVEGMQLLKILQGEQNGWASHPVRKLWITAQGEPLVAELSHYLDVLAAEWSRQYSPHAWEKVSLHTEGRRLIWPNIVHVRMRGNLLRKDSKHYELQFVKFGLELAFPVDYYEYLHPRFA